MTTQENGTSLVRHGEAVNTPGLAKADPSRAYEPADIKEAFYLAEVLVKSRLLPDSVKTPEAAFAIIVTGRELGLSAMQSLRSIHVINGKTILSADLVASLVKSRRDVCAYFVLVESTTERATYRTHRVGEPDPTTMSFTMDDAKRAGLMSNNTLTKYPAQMLRARCITGLARAVYPDLAMGLYDSDEIEAPIQRAPYEVIRQPEASAVAPVAANLVPAMLSKVAAATTVSEVNAVAKAAGKAHANGAIGDEDLEAIKRDVLARRLALTDTPSGPTVVVDDAHGPNGEG